MSKRKDRKKMIEVPLFPGYLFVRSMLLPDEHLSILKTPGAVRIIGGPSGPSPVGDDEVESLKIMVGSGQNIITSAGFQAGEKVMVVFGPFTGVTGVFSEYRGQGRVMVNIELMGQSAAVNVSEEDIKRI
jgi:transcription antitermination factor NusG